MHINRHHTHCIPRNRRIYFQLHYLIPTFVEAGGYLEKLHDMLQDSVTMMMMAMMMMAMMMMAMMMMAMMMMMIMMMMMMMRIVMDSDNRYR
jgi:hypothetical protein